MSDVNKTNTLEQANAPPGTDLVIPENLPPIKVMNPGLYKNLCEQVTSIYKHCNELSFGTRKRHYEATKRFCGFLADNFRLQKFKNVEDRHFRAYVEYLIESGGFTGNHSIRSVGYTLFPQTVRQQKQAVRK